jgi:aminobenzoyl-glutamate utilization protein A
MGISASGTEKTVDGSVFMSSPEEVRNPVNTKKERFDGAGGHQKRAVEYQDGGSAARYERRALAYRRQFHSHPETGWLCFYATAVIAEQLKACGYRLLVGRELLGDIPLADAPTEQEADAAIRRARDLISHSGGQASMAAVTYWLNRMQRRTGVLAVLEPAAGRWSHTVMYRFDMDALPIGESEKPDHFPRTEGFASDLQGVSHACGHDGHMAAGLVFAERIAREKVADLCRTRFLFLFQPAEEGVRGASAVAERLPLLAGGKIDRFFAGHIGFTEPDCFVAGAGGFLETSKFDAVFTGKSAHAGRNPEDGRNALLAAAQAVTAMYQIEKPGSGIGRINVGVMRAGEARNAIAAHARIAVETRGSGSVENKYMKNQGISCIMDAARQNGVSAEIVPMGESVCADSSPDLARKVLAMPSVRAMYSRCRVSQAFGASEDAAVLMNYVQRQGGEAVYMLFGTPLAADNHQPDFDFDESVLGRMLRIFYESAMLEWN